MENLRCTTEASLFRSPIACPDCSRDYEIYELRHKCHELARCDAVAKSYYEDYLPAVVDMPRKSIAVCEECVKKAKSAPPRRGKCPKCEFAGYCVWSSGGLCPSCIPIATPIVSKASATSIPNASVPNTPAPIIKTDARIFFKLKHTGTCPADGKCTNITIMVATNKSLATPEFFTHAYTSSDVTIEVFIGVLQRWLGEKRLKYNLHWQGSSDLKWEWLKYLYTLHADPNGPLLV